jgi:hypothetical protein
MIFDRIRVHVIVLTLLALGALVLGVIPSSRTIHIYLVLVVALAAYAAVRDASQRFDAPQRLRRRLRLRHRHRVLPPYFERVVRTIELASMTSAQYEPVRRRLRLIAEQRLAAHGVLLDSGRAQELLGADAWALLEEIPHERRFERGPRPRELRQLIDALERM